MSKTIPSVILILLGSLSAAARDDVKVDANLEADGKLISNATSGPPIEVASGALVPGLNVDRLDGLDASSLAGAAQTAAAIVALDADIAGLEAELSSPPAPVAQTGQTECYDVIGEVIKCELSEGQDGHYRAGVPLPQPRFTQHGDGTVTDNLTGLVWLEYTACRSATWAEALTLAQSLFDGASDFSLEGDCGLSDGSLPGQWRLPTIRELLSLQNYAFSEPVVSNSAGTGPLTPGDPFPGFGHAFFWSSTSLASGPGTATDQAWTLVLFNGNTFAMDKASGAWFWPVRDPRGGLR